MKNTAAFIAGSHIRNVLLCSLLTFGLAACGSESGSSSSDAASTVSDAIPSLVTPNVGVIDRASEGDVPSAAGNADATVAANTTQSTAPASSSTVVAPTTAPVTGGSTSGSGGSSTGGSGSPTGVATLDWMPPTENSDGSVLTNLAGYTVYYGTSASNLTQSVKITNPGLSAYTLSDLSSGTWYFAVTSYSSTGVESTRSGVVSSSI